MTILKAGDIRKEGDETRFLGQDTFQRAAQVGADYLYQCCSSWLPVRLLGHAILPSDLIVSEFRRLNAPDLVNHPPHYTSHPSGVECITITQHHNFCVGNAIKYLWRAGLKEGAPSITDLKKAVWYINTEIDRLASLVP